MKLLATKTNVDAPSAAYPFGKIRNKTLSVAGTPVDVEVYGDMHQFFEKMFDASGITANGLPDNVTNGFQLYEAFVELTHPAWSASGLSFETVGLNTWGNAGVPFYDVAYKAMPNEVALCGVATISSGATGDVPVLSLPSVATPTKDVYVSAKLQDGAGAILPCLLYISTLGVVTVLGMTVTLADYFLYLDGITFRK